MLLDVSIVPFDKVDKLFLEFCKSPFIRLSLNLDLNLQA